MDKALATLSGIDALTHRFARVLLALLIVWSTLCRIIAVQPVYRYGEMNADEERNFRIAQNHVAGDGYTLDGKQTSFHSSIPVFVYEWLIREGIPKSYWIRFIHYLSILLFIPASVSLFFMVRATGAGALAALTAVGLFVFYPSNSLYIGPLFWYEKVALPLFILCLWQCMRVFTHRSSSAPMYVNVLLVMAMCLVRNQMLAISVLMVALFGIWAIFSSGHRTVLLRIMASTLAGVVLALLINIPVLVKNHGQFGRYVISTQAGYELMQGHSQMARGSWLGGWDSPGSEYYRFSREVIPGLDAMNELEESDARKDHAIRWAITHPFQEVVLSIRKVAIFFMPINFQGPAHATNLLVHGLFFLSLLWLMFKRRITYNIVLLLLPIAADILLCLIFFTDMRWRFYAEPFMIGIACIGTAQIVGATLGHLRTRA
jgi:hypothetical protein